ncbi:MAG: hypothetical protein PHH49_04835 [Candidatus Omnitrophica bacterium]|nr:hypothetical protein [Candidatus Omnitrophota bacterium]MDD5488271.1 hypothetical protein [Candidatus Omnitrophota bacterium]
MTRRKIAEIILYISLISITLMLSGCCVIKPVVQTAGAVAGLAGQAALAAAPFFLL